MMILTPRSPCDNLMPAGKKSRFEYGRYPRRKDKGTATEKRTYPGRTWRQSEYEKLKEYSETNGQTITETMLEGFDLLMKKKGLKA